MKVTVPGFGNTTTVEKLNQNGLIPIPYFSDFVNHFVERGYERGKDIRAAPYDWRLAPGILHDVYSSNYILSTESDYAASMTSL